MTELKVNLKVDAGFVSMDAPTERVLEIILTAPETRRKNAAAPLNLGLVIDRSGSMSGGKLDHAKEAVRQILDLMRPQDSVSIVDYDNVVNITAEVDSVTEQARHEILGAVRHLRPGGSTDLGGGWLQGCECVARRLGPGKVSRTLLLTDGLANVGITDPGELSRHASALFERGVATSTFGIGEDFNEHLLESMANNGGGNYYFIASAQQIPNLLVEEFSDLAAVTLHNVTLELNLPDGVMVELLGDWRSKLAAHKLIIYFSDLSSGRMINLFVRFTAPAGAGQLVMNAVVKGVDEDGKKILQACEINLQYASQSKVDAAVLDPDLQQRYTIVVAGHASNEALKLEREGKRNEAGEVLDNLISEYGPNLPAPLREHYQTTRENIRRGLTEREHKEEHSLNYISRKSLVDEFRRLQNK